MLHPGRCISDRRQSAFTLLELLAAIVIIAIVAAMLVPLASQFIQRGQAVGCIGNLRQIYMGISLYAADHNGRLPPAQDAYPPAPGAKYWFRDPDMWGRQYVAQTQQELKKILRCPADKTHSTRDDYISYGHAPHFLQHWAFGAPTFSANKPGVIYYRYVRLAEVGGKVLMADIITTEPFGAQGSFPPIRSKLEQMISDRHNGKANVLFGSGSVRAMSKQELLNNLNLFNIFSL